MTKTEIALLRWGQLPMFAAIVGWILGFVGVAAGLWRPHWYWVILFHRHRGHDSAVHPANQRGA